MEKLQDYASFIHTILPRIQSIRQDLHQHPELGFSEVRTQQVILRELATAGIIGSPVAGTGVVAHIQGNRPGRHVALRADMDALPMPDESNLPYQSVNPNACHACGHDAHMAIMIGTAWTLVQSNDFPGEITFVFQPSEEQLPGGAPSILQSGVLDSVDGIFGLHVWRGVPFGTVASVPGPMMAAPDDFIIQITGRGGHASMPEQTVDPVLVAAHLVTALQSVVSRSISVHDQVVLSVTQIHAGTAHNVIPETAELRGTVRILNPKMRPFIRARMQQVIEGVAQTYGANAYLDYMDGYPVLINHADMTTFALSVARNIFGEAQVQTAVPSMGGEDFAYYLERIPGCFLWLGLGEGYPHHHPKFDAGDDALLPGVQLMSALAHSFLKQS